MSQPIVTSNVYFLVNESLNLLKIGKADIVQIRAMKLQKAGSNINPNKSFYMVVESASKAFDIEKFFHDKYRSLWRPLDKKIDGWSEWFDIKILQDPKFHLYLECCAGTSSFQRGTGKKRAKLIKKIDFDLSIPPAKIYKESRTKNKIPEFKLILPILTALLIHKKTSLKAPLSQYVLNSLVLTNEEKLAPSDRNTSFIDIRLDNIISHKTLESNGFCKILKVNGKVHLQLLDNGIFYIKNRFELQPIYFLLFLLSQEASVYKEDLLFDLQLLFNKKESLMLISSNSDYFIKETIENEDFFYISKSGVSALNTYFRGGKPTLEKITYSEETLF